jgi:polar amino acid transport system substrate-binding protein
MCCAGLLSAFAAQAQAPLPPWQLRLCANMALGQPADNQGSGYELLRRAQALWPGLQVEITLLPWTRCLHEAGQGQFDGVLAASWTAERADTLAYPLGSDGKPDARKRMFRIGYALMRLKSSTVRWDGVRVTGTRDKPGEALAAERGYSIVAFARAHGAVVEDRFPNSGSVLESLRLGRTAGALLNQEHAASLLREQEWAAIAELSGPALDTKHYFLPVNKALAEREPERVRLLWSVLAQARQAPSFQRHFSANMSAGQRKDLQP